MAAEGLRLNMTRNIAVGIVLLAGALLTAFCAKADGIFTATLLGSGEVPPTGSSATGFITVTLTGNILSVDETFSGLIGGPAAAAHLQCCAGPCVKAPVQTPFAAYRIRTDEATRTP